MNEWLQRGSGVLCHISSLPNKYGIGSLGKEAYEFADWLKSAHVKYWQILPLSQTGYGDSPYSSVFSNSGNPYFIDLEALRDEGLIDDEELSNCEVTEGPIDYGALYSTRFNVLRLAYARFNLKDKDFVKFEKSGEFDEYAIFMSLKTRYAGSFDTFPDPYKYGEYLAINDFKSSVYKSDYCFWLFVQFIFRKQWFKLKEYVNSLGIKIIGDMPLYVAYDSADVWSHPEYFKLDKELRPTEVAATPPDNFSPKGQLWGNPVYNWEVMEADGFEWWLGRLKNAVALYDVIRIDHFLGFDKYFSVPAGETTAEKGEWKQGPGLKLFMRIKRKLGDVALIAEDLGAKSHAAAKFRERTGFPGMKVMLFAFDGEEDNPNHPMNVSENFVAYTGTHDNPTTLGLLNKMNGLQFSIFKDRLREALEIEKVVFPFSTRTEATLALCVCVMASNAKLAILPVQDLLGYDDAARMNVPSTVHGNWRFRLFGIPDRKTAAILRKLNKEFNR
ncbi:MAG: 4-alpha-glucanotransferase [Clostridia bacterium]|nr:4-alpha-glucanotransferase [Clostridia bacterium]